MTSNHTGSDEAGGHSSSGQHQVFPESLFTQQQLLDGAIVLYVLGDVYMFICLALVCEEFFVPAVTIITEHFGLSEDVAGATLFAFAGSGPEIFTSFIGVFISQTSIGIGTIVGSAVFNLTVVHGICAVVSAVAIQLGWWAVFRDFFFYSLSLVLLIIFFADDLILWWESLLLICTYIIYVTFMKYNQRIRERLQSRFCAKSVGESSTELPDRADHHHTAGGEDADDKLHKVGAHCYMYLCTSYKAISLVQNQIS
jgi:sodium/potassium/calcium exchanger 2